MDSNAAEPHTAPNMSTPTTHSLTLAAICTLDEDRFVERLGPVVEHSPWVARRAWGRGPFATRQALFDALSAEIREAGNDEQLALLRVHPELAGQEARAGSMTADSQSEQGRLGLLRLDASTVRRIEDLNRRYRERFGFPSSPRCACTRRWTRCSPTANGASPTTKSRSAASRWSRSAK